MTSIQLQIPLIDPTMLELSDLIFQLLSIGLQLKDFVLVLVLGPLCLNQLLFQQTGFVLK